ncbi:Lcl C-terminal domain-containing protein [Paraburkholderia sediminicola]|uniref:DUF1566 domain-containing protein n=1 Tax=Paraburkholderia sediminicola TaxID=458836 RepID=UPI0038BA47EB
MTITLESIRAEHAKVAEMIAEFEKQAATKVFHLPAATITLAPGERYAGVVLGHGNVADHHLILLPGQAEDLAWNDAIQWASAQGGELPTRREQSLLFANLKSEFESAYYWSGEAHEKEAGWAWYQNFDYGGQGYYRQVSGLRARAVRRLILQ